MPQRKRRAGGAVTILDVARHAGVSPMTASRVINDHPGVGEVLRARVVASVKALGYRPNLAGRSLRTSGAARVGVLYSNPSAAYLNQFMLGVLEQGSSHGCLVLVEKCGGLRSQRAAVQRLRDAGVDGIVLPPPLCDSPQMLAELARDGIPAVAVAGGAAPDAVASVRIDDYAGARTMMRYLLELGHRDIAIIKGDPSHAPARLRAKAYFEAMAGAGIDVPDAFVAEGLFTYRSGLAAANALLRLRRRPTAIFSSNDDMAAAAIAVAHGMGLRIPEDLTVTGFDDTPVATTIWPGLTTIHQPVAAMGRSAVGLVLEQVRTRRAGRPLQPVHQVMKHVLVKRQSSAPPGA
jgi:LacI family transcriptional regulator